MWFTMYGLRQALVLSLLATAEALPRPSESGTTTLVRRTASDFGPQSQPPPARPELDVSRETTMQAYIRGDYMVALVDERYQWWQRWDWDCKQKMTDEIPNFRDLQDWCHRKYLELWNANPNQLPMPLPPPSAQDPDRRTSMQMSTTPGAMQKSWFLSKVGEGVNRVRSELSSGESTRRAVHSLAMAATTIPRNLKMLTRPAALPLRAGI